MDTTLNFMAQLKQLTQRQTHPLHDLHAYSGPHRILKFTVFYNNDYIKTIAILN